MRSLWKDLARRWLGGEPSDALAGDSPLTDLLTPKSPPLMGDAFRVARQPAVSSDTIARTDGDASSKKPSEKWVAIEPH